MNDYPGIFNDVIGPVMRGPSSSHTAASWRIATTALDILNDRLESALIEFDREGAWAPNYREQGTTIGIDGGLLRLEITDERMKATESYARQMGVAIDYQVSAFPTRHANTVRLTLRGVSKRQVQVVAISTGGGSFELQSVDGFDVQLKGDQYVLLFKAKKHFDIPKELERVNEAAAAWVSIPKEDEQMAVYRSSKPFSPEFIGQLQDHPEIGDLAVIHPVMPVISGNQREMPFTSLESLPDYTEKVDMHLGKAGLIYEQCLSGMTERDLYGKMDGIIQIIHNSIDTGLKGTTYEDRILQQQSHLIGKAAKAGRFRDTIVNRIVAYVTALMESKSGMEVIVAAPTAGSCGTLGGVLRAVAEDSGSGHQELINAYFAAGLVGAYFAQGPGFSAEEHGCQVECGAASGMAAAGIVQLLGGTARQAIDAASMAIQNMIGLVCDPVADRVEVPCLGKNISAAVNAYTSAIMAVSGFDAVIPLDEVIGTVSKVSSTMPTCVKCTGRGGLAITRTSMLLKKSLKDQHGDP
jgi:L-serine dehydratase